MAFIIVKCAACGRAIWQDTDYPRWFCSHACEFRGPSDIDLGAWERWLVTTPREANQKPSPPGAGE